MIFLQLRVKINTQWNHDSIVLFGGEKKSPIASDFIV